MPRLPSGEIRVEKGSFWLADGSKSFRPDTIAELQGLLRIAVLCNNATLEHVSAEDSGDPMELALLRAGRLASLTRELRVKPLRSGNTPSIPSGR